MKRPLIIAALLLAAIVAAWWWAAPREYSGILVNNLGAYRVPESPPPVAFLRTTTGGYELEFPDRTIYSKLAKLDGKQVVVRGRLHVRHVGALVRRIITVRELTTVL